MNSIKYRNLEFTKNNIYVIFGDNGVGKTTFLTSIFLFKKCFNESIYYDGKSTDSLSRSEKNKFQRNMIFMKSKGNLLDFLTVKENLEYFKIDPDIINRTKFLDKKPNELSGGEEQISSLSLLFQKDKEVLLLDEITSFMDQENESKAKKILHELKKDRIIIFTTHDIRFRMDDVINVNLKEVLNFH